VKLVLAGLLAAGCLLAQNVPQLIFTKAFPGSVPAFESLTIDRSGALSYSESRTDPKPLQQAKLSERETAELFSLADKLNHFQSPLESGLKVANTGKKTFRYVDAAGKVSETTFNYSIDESAKLLLDKLEQIAASERAYLDLDRTIHFDHLGVNDSLAEIEELWIRKQLAAPDQFIPLLTRVTNHEAYMHLARDRAARLKSEFLQPAPPAAGNSK
jgi:hypothetical protein